MNWNFSAWSIRNPVPAILLFAVLMLMGLQAFSRLPITQFPNIDVPVIAVSVGQSGAAPAELETQITKRIEDAVSRHCRGEEHHLHHVGRQLRDGHRVPS